MNVSLLMIAMLVAKFLGITPLGRGVIPVSLPVLVFITWMCVHPAALRILHLLHVREDAGLIQGKGKRVREVLFLCVYCLLSIAIAGFTLYGYVGTGEVKVSTLTAVVVFLLGGCIKVLRKQKEYPDLRRQAGWFLSLWVCGNVLLLGDAGGMPSVKKSFDMERYQHLLDGCRIGSPMRRLRFLWSTALTSCEMRESK
jgi:hypothetical protein